MRDDEPDPASVAALCLALIAALCVCAAATADGQDADPAPMLARCVHAEAGPRAAADHAAIAHAIGRQAARAGRSYAVQLRAYCHGLRRGAARVTAERARLPRLAAEVDARAAAYFAGELPDPCPGAMHWGGYHADVDRARIDAAVASGRLERVECSAPTLNWFGREVRR